jgi:hypothetical protein
MIIKGMSDVTFLPTVEALHLIRPSGRTVQQKSGINFKPEPQANQPNLTNPAVISRAMRRRVKSIKKTSTRTKNAKHPLVGEAS